MLKFLKVATALALISSPAVAETFGLGRAALPEEIAAWDKDVRPDGTGLPVGSGDVLTGEEVFADQCAVCHGDFAEGVDNWPKLAGGADLDTFIPEVFALVREASQRTLGLRHFDVQLMGGWVMLQGQLAEMETGEGKTLAATLARRVPPPWFAPW